LALIVLCYWVVVKQSLSINNDSPNKVRPIIANRHTAYYSTILRVQKLSN